VGKPACGPARIERALAGAYGAADMAVLAASVRSVGSGVVAAPPGLGVAWTGPPAPAAPRAGSVACLLDGEIYNLEVIAELARVPADTSPESTLAAAYVRVGERIVSYLRGEFALLLWDARSRTGLLARDQLGSGNLFLHAAAGHLVFATELRYLLEVLRRTPGPNGQALVQWLAEGALPADRTLFEGVFPLPPASLLRLHSGGWETRRYWAPRYVEPRRLDPDQAACELRRAVMGAVTQRLNGRGTAGLLLSGGLDSGTVLAAADHVANTTGTSLRVYSAVFPDHASTDESELIELQLKRYALPALRSRVTDGSPLYEALRYLDQWRVPLPVPGHFIWQPLLAAAASEGAECLLDGEVGDELFGAAVFLLADRIRAGRLRKALRLAHTLPGAGASPGRRLLLSLVRRNGLAPWVPPGLLRLLPTREAPWWLTRTQARRYTRNLDPQPWRSLSGPRWWAQLADAVTRAPDRIGFFDYFRRRGRSAGVPAHHPFLDLDTIEAVLRLPPEHGFDPSLTRPLLRRAMRGLVPEQVRMRPGKSYFDPLLVDCLAVHDGQLVRRLLSGPNVEVLSFADAAGVQELIDGGPAAHPRGATSWMLDVWRLATAECWLRSQSDRGFARRLLEELAGTSAGSRPLRAPRTPASHRLVPFSALTTTMSPVSFAALPSPRFEGVHGVHKA
jgi:asparagine synthase (glutamine-hydrolysing)